MPLPTKHQIAGEYIRQAQGYRNALVRELVGDECYDNLIGKSITWLVRAATRELASRLEAREQGE